MSVDPRGLLAHVHPDLVKVIEAAAQSPQPFQVDYGIRTLAAEKAAVSSGHSETLHSRHLPDARYGGVAMAVDVIALDNAARGGIFAEGHESAVFGQIAEQIKAEIGRASCRERVSPYV